MSSTYSVYVTRRDEKEAIRYLKQNKHFSVTSVNDDNQILCITFHMLPYMRLRPTLTTYDLHFCLPPYGTAVFNITKEPACSEILTDRVRDTSKITKNHADEQKEEVNVVSKNGNIFWTFGKYIKAGYYVLEQVTFIISKEASLFQQ